MKKGLKFIIALLIAGSLGIWFLPVMETAVKSVSVADVFKIGMGYYDKAGEGDTLMQVPLR